MAEPRAMRPARGRGSELTKGGRIRRACDRRDDDPLKREAAVSGILIEVVVTREHQRV